MSHSWYENEEPASVRKFSVESDDQNGPGGLRRMKKKKMTGSESLANSLASNLNKISQGPLEVNKMFLTDDYFSDVNPRSMRYEGFWSLIKVYINIDDFQEIDERDLRDGSAPQGLRD